LTLPRLLRSIGKAQRSAQQLKQLACFKEAREANVLPRDVTAFLSRCLETVGAGSEADAPNEPQHSGKMPLPKPQVRPGNE
jgi:hypothetical protein